MVINGFTEGQRNMQAVSLSGYLLRIEVDPNIAYQIIQKINSESDMLLPDKEINALFRSVYNKERQRAKRGIA